MKIRGYKIVVKFKEYFIPCVQRYGANTIYFPHKWTSRKPENGPLCVFSTEWKARIFLINNPTIISQARIFTCIYTPSAEKCVYLNCGTITPLDCMPVGTVLAESVYLLEDITNKPYEK